MQSPVTSNKRLQPSHKLPKENSVELQIELKAMALLICILRLLLSHTLQLAASLWTCPMAPTPTRASALPQNSHGLRQAQVFRDVSHPTRGDTENSRALLG